MPKFALASAFFLALALTGSPSAYGTLLRQFGDRAAQAIDTRHFAEAERLYRRAQRSALARGDTRSALQFSNCVSTTISREQAFAAYQAGSFSRAASLFETLYSQFKKQDNTESALRMLSNLGSVRLALFEYPQALSAYLNAKRLIEERHERKLAPGIYSNLANLYIQLGDLPSADHAAEQGLQAAELSDPLDIRSALLTTLGWLRARENQTDAAVQYFREAIHSAYGADHFDATIINILGDAWDSLGEQMLLLGRYDAAEQPLTEAFRLRLLFKDRDLRTSLIKLAWLRIEQDDTRSASALLRRAAELPANDVSAPSWFVAWLWGRLQEKRGHSRAALAWYRKALEEGNRWQQGAPPVDELRATSAAQFLLQQVYRSFVQADLTSDPKLGLEAFLATERGRDTALQETLDATQAWRGKLPPAYWSTLQKLRLAEARQIATGQDETAVRGLRQALQDYEAQAGSAISSNGTTKSLEKRSASKALSDIQEEIRPGEALLSFYLSERGSLLWAVTSNTIEMHRLPAAKPLLGLSGAFQAAVERREAGRDPLGQRLYRELFGQLSAHVQQQPCWILAAADELYRTPFAALVVGTQGNKPVYLAERHSALSTPSAFALRSGLKPFPVGAFVGVGDGIYNSADSRWRPLPRRESFFGLAFAVDKPKPALQLARLAASGVEIDTCARIWSGTQSSTLLTGDLASRSSLEDSLRHQPAVVHLATHVLYPGTQPEKAFIDLGLNPDGQPDLLTSEDIGGLRIPGSTVVMSGCSSGAAPAKAGAGVLGLSRAWLIAGARAVVASRWPTPDDTGELFRSFYSYLRVHKADAANQRIVAEALHAAQLDMLRSSTWRSDPQYWAAYYVLGKD